MSTNQVGYFQLPPPPTFRERIKQWLLPERAISNPQMNHKDMLVCRTTCLLSWADRVRILVTGKLMVETRTVTENEIGAHKTKSVSFPIL